MQDQFKGDDLFQNLKDGFSEIGKKVSGFMDDVMSGEPLAGELTVRTDVYRAYDQYVIELELPGVQKSDVSIQVHEGVLMVKGEKKEPVGNDRVSYIKQERKFGTFIRNFPLPVNAELEGIKAKYDSGVLTIRFAMPPLEEGQDPSTNINID
ncbi:Hsp20/alpha crystallin family protein [Pontibacter sp. G13]|uniref:Hsp20/alpha crystallin family protein n=1 Tax=Pontibacter sp. G13 TaxID=3074898 RepID=UPI00288B5AA5|nr:Hsp20/alpha crystallin family protein [Pontibacter sp. G13]WNJ20807.1 Hsp20/alpha crystallin family protein [Pontibacter sp. G13]